MDITPWQMTRVFTRFFKTCLKRPILIYFFQKWTKIKILDKEFYDGKNSSWLNAFLFLAVSDKRMDPFQCWVFGIFNQILNDYKQPQALYIDEGWQPPYFGPFPSQITGKNVNVWHSPFPLSPAMTRQDFSIITQVSI